MTKRRKKPISEERILQLSNDAAEIIRSGTAAEWRQVASYWQNQHNRLWNDVGRLRCSIAALCAAESMHMHAVREMDVWLKAQTATSTA